MIPSKVFFTKGTGHGPNEILSFEHALREAQISYYNLVKVSSILPPHCERVSLEEGISLLSPGQIIYLVLSRITVDNSEFKSPRRIYASIGTAQPKNRTIYGYIAESNGMYTSEKNITQKSIELAINLLYTSKNGAAQFDVDSSVIFADTYTNKEEKYTTCIAAAVFIE